MRKEVEKYKEEKKIKKLSQFLKSHILGTLEAISLKLGMWSAEVGGSVHSKNRIVSSRQHRATEVRKLRFLSSCQYTHWCCAPASWAARHTTVCLDTHGCFAPASWAARHTAVCLDIMIAMLSMLFMLLNHYCYPLFYYFLLLDPNF